MLALINSDNEITASIAEDTRFKLPNGNVIAPAMAGWEGSGFNLMTIDDSASIPIGKISASHTIEMVAGIPTRVLVLEDAPVQSAAPLSARQFRLALIQAGILPSIQAAIDALEEPTRSWVTTEWEYSTEFDRDHPMVIGLSAQVGLTPEQVDTMWIWAATI